MPKDPAHASFEEREDHRVIRVGNDDGDPCAAEVLDAADDANDVRIDRIRDDDTDDCFADLVFSYQVDHWFWSQPRHDAGLGKWVRGVHVRGNAMPHPAHLNSFAL